MGENKLSDVDSNTNSREGGMKVERYVLKNSPSLCHIFDLYFITPLAHFL